MNRLLGYSLISVGLLGFLFFLNYKGSTIPLHELWFVLCIFTILAGGYFFAKYKLQKSNKQRSGSSNRLAEIERLKLTGDKVKVTLDNAEVKTKSYQKEIISDGLPSRMEMLDALYDDNRNYRAAEIRQTYIVFYKHYNGREYKYISQPTTQDATIVKMHIDRRKGIDLYIDLKDPTIYYFELPYL